MDLSKLSAMDVSLITRVYISLRKEHSSPNCTPVRLARTLTYLVLMGIREEKQLIAIAPFLW